MNEVWGRNRGWKISRGVGGKVWRMSSIGGGDCNLNVSKGSVNSWEGNEFVIVVEVESGLVGIVQCITINSVLNCVWEKNVILTNNQLLLVMVKLVLRVPQTFPATLSSLLENKSWKCHLCFSLVRSGLRSVTSFP